MFETPQFDYIEEARKQLNEIPVEPANQADPLPAEDVVKKRSKKSKLVTETKKLQKKIEEELSDELKEEVETKKNSKNEIIRTVKFLRENWDFRYNSISKQTEIKRKGEKYFKKFDDIEYHDLSIAISLSGISLTDEKFKHIIYGTMVAERYNPLTEYFFSLPKWDGKTDYIKDYCSILELQDENKREFVNECFKKWIVGCVGSIINENEVNHLCLILVGGQGTGKSTFLNNLVPKNLKKDYLYSNTFLPHSKDHILFLATKWLINLDELEVFNKTDIRTIKSVITQPQVELRKAYTKESIIAKRIASFCGSVNNVEFLNDETGSRRFLPIHVKNIRYTENKSLDKMYAQAFALYKDDTFIHYINATDLKHLEIYNDDFKILTMEEEMVLKFFRKPSEEELKTKRVMISYLQPNEIVDLLCKKFDKLNHNSTVKNNVGKALSKYNFNKVTKRLTGYDKPLKVWEVIYEENQFKDENFVPTYPVKDDFF